MEKKLSNNRILYTDLVCLSSTNFEDLNKNTFPPNALIELANKNKQFDDFITRDSLKNELLSFSGNWNEFKKSVSESYEVINYDKDDDNDIEMYTHISYCKSCMNSRYAVIWYYKNTICIAMLILV